MITMIEYKSTLLGRTEIAEGTMAFEFQKPNDFVFKAGQSIDLTLLGHPQERSDALTHTFSIASAPSDEEVLVATRMRDTAFKRALSTLPIGTEVQIKGPMGSFTLHNNTARPAVLLAGGIGIAPFLSILAHAAAQRLGHPIFLFYANRYLEDAAFIGALGTMERVNPRFRFIPTFTRMTKLYLGWTGETGHITGEMLSTHVGDLRGPIFYVAGPLPMVAAARRTLIQAAVDEDDIRTEEFSGY